MHYIDIVQSLFCLKFMTLALKTRQTFRPIVSIVIGISQAVGMAKSCGL